MKHKTIEVISEILYLEKKKRVLEHEDYAVSSPQLKNFAWGRVKEIEDVISDFESSLTQTTCADDFVNEWEIWQFS